MITTLGLNWLSYQEAARSNAAKEAENMRHNLATEAEANRSNKESERLTGLNISESNRHNLITEAEANRANKAREIIDMEKVKETHRSNTVGEEFDRFELGMKNASNALKTLVGNGLVTQSAFNDFTRLYDEVLKAWETGEYDSSTAAGKLAEAFSGIVGNIKNPDADGWLNSALDAIYKRTKRTQPLAFALDPIFDEKNLNYLDLALKGKITKEQWWDAVHSGQLHGYNPQGKYY